MDWMPTKTADLHTFPYLARKKYEQLPVLLMTNVSAINYVSTTLHHHQKIDYRSIEHDAIAICYGRLAILSVAVFSRNIYQ